MRDVRKEHEDIRHAADKGVAEGFRNDSLSSRNGDNLPDLKIARSQSECAFVDFFKSQCDQGLPEGRLIDQISKIKNDAFRNRALLSLSLCELKFATVEEAIKTAALIEIDDASQRAPMKRFYFIYAIMVKNRKRSLLQKLVSANTLKRFTALIKQRFSAR